MAVGSSHLTRYLLGGLSEEEQTALEEQYVADPRLFDEIALAESDLVDDYVRGRLPNDTRERFERVYLSDSRRRERVTFAEALLASVKNVPSVSREARSRTWFGWLAAPKPALGLAFATLLIASGVWMVFEVRRTQRDALQRQTARTEQPPPNFAPEIARPAAVVVVTLAAGSGTRAPDLASPAPVVIPTGTSEVRMQLSLQENDYSAYRVSVRQLGSAEIARRDRLTAVAEGSVFVITITVPASAFASADYVVTLQGAASGGFDDLSHSLLRVDKQ